MKRHWISQHYLRICCCFTGYRFFVDSPYFVTFNMSPKYIYGSIISNKKSAISLLTWVSLHITSCFFLTVFRICSLSLIFSSFTLKCLGVDSFVFIIIRVQWAFQWIEYVFQQIGELFNYYFFKYFSALFTFFSTSGTQYSSYMCYDTLKFIPHSLEALFILYSVFLDYLIA